MIANKIDNVEVRHINRMLSENHSKARHEEAFQKTLIGLQRDLENHKSLEYLSGVFWNF